MIIGRNAGIAFITATSINNKSASLIVQVTEDSSIVSVTGVEIIGSSNISMIEGDQKQLTAVVTPDNATDKSITWASSNTGVAVVSNDGLVKAISDGTTIISATVNGITASVKVTVSKKTATEIPVTSISLASNVVDMKIGEKTFVKYSILPVNATNTDTTWSSSNTAVATVDEKTGEITAVSTGNAIITIKVGNKSAQLIVNVTEKTADYVEVTGVQLKTSSYTLKENQTYQLLANVLPTNATNKEITWTSSDESIATVSKDGLVTAIAAGEVTITASSVNGKSASCHIIVEKNVIDQPTTSEDKTTVAGETTTVEGETTTAAGETTTAAGETTVATDETTTAPAATTPAATAATTPAATAPTTAPSTVPPVTGIKMNRTTANVVVGKTKKVTVKLTPSNIVDPGVVFTSANSSIATVDANGNIKGKKPGKTIVTARTSNGLTAQVKVTVRPAQVKGLKKVSVKSTSVKISWKKQKNVTGYMIYTNVGTSKKYKYYKTTKKTSIVIKNLKKNTSYRFKVRAYKSVSGSKITGACSDAAKAKTKR